MGGYCSYTFVKRLIIILIVITIITIITMAIRCSVNNVDNRFCWWKLLVAVG